jgi:hypothetical protein
MWEDNRSGNKYRHYFLEPLRKGPMGIKVNKMTHSVFSAVLNTVTLLLLLLLLLLLSLAPEPSLGLGLLHKIRLNFLEASQQFSFLQGRVVSPTPNPHSGGPGLYIYITQRQGGYPF